MTHRATSGDGVKTPRDTDDDHDNHEHGDGVDDGGDDIIDLSIRAIKTKKAHIKQCSAAKAGCIPKHPFRMLLTGASGSGKSTFLINLIDRLYKDVGGRKYFDDIYAIGPTVKFDDLYETLGLDDKHLIEEPTVEFLEKIFHDQKAAIKSKGIDKAKKILIIYEDIIGHKKFMNSKEFLKSFVMSRHFNVSVMVCSQSYTKVPRPCRLQCTQIAFFPSKKSEMDLICDEYCPPKMTKKEFQEIVDHATTPVDEEDHPFLYIDMNERPKKRFRKTLKTRLVLNEDAPDKREPKRRRYR
jgi:hypothetical protein